MATVNQQAELSKAGANVQGRFGAFLHWCRTYPLGALGGLITLLFVLVAIFAEFMTIYDPTTTNSASSRKYSL